MIEIYQVAHGIDKDGERFGKYRSQDLGNKNLSKIPSGNHHEMHEFQLLFSNLFSALESFRLRFRPIGYKHQLVS